MATYLIHTANDQVIKTRGRGIVACVAYSNPAWYERNRALGAAFESILAGDQVLICRDQKLRSLAAVETATFEIDDGVDPKYVGKPVKLLEGPLLRRFDVAVEAVMKRVEAAGLPVPVLINPKRTGFKQGAFCSAVADETVAAILRDWPTR